MKKSVSISIAILFMLTMFSTAGMARTTGVHDASILIDQEEVTLNEPLYIKDGRVFVPLRFISEALDAEVKWHQNTKQVELNTSFGDKAWFNINSKILDFNGKEYVMDAKPFLNQGRTYLPLRQVSDILHTRVSWDSKEKTAYLTTVPLYKVQAGDAVETISKNQNIEISDLKRLNRIENHFLQIDQELKVITPEFLNNPLNQDDVELLAKIISIEAGYESYEGQVAVGNVIMNRVEHPSFPNSIREVVYAPGQFPPAHNGKLERAQPKDEAYQAARAALGGTTYAGDALYFYNPKVTKSSFFTSKEVVATIGNHRFVK